MHFSFGEPPLDFLMAPSIKTSGGATGKGTPFVSGSGSTVLQCADVLTGLQQITFDEAAGG